ncbi:MAG: DUF5686 and carboxypeptidase regulatory-like domain-containing protein [Leeuwenhoekiella sp.]
MHFKPHQIQLKFGFVFLMLLLVKLSVSAQITGTVTNESGETLPFVNVYVSGTAIGTTTNNEGVYNLNLQEPDDYKIIFQYLGYAKKEMTVAVTSFPYILNVSLSEESTTLDEVFVDGSINPANEIIRKTIAQKEQVLQKQDAFTADFYSRGLWKVKDAPEKILGRQLGDFGGNLDSTRTGIVYLSETISQIAYRAPDDFKETITASKVSGDDNGFSFNSAQEADFSFYENTLDLNTQLVSPIASNAFNYYDYKLLGSFRESGKLINKIEVTPKRPKDRVFFGILYIVEDDWQLYGIQLETTGSAIQIPFVEDLLFTQNFKYDENLNLWVKTSQVIDFSFKLFGVKGDGRFTAVYSNYDFDPNFDRKTFTNQILAFAPKANEKDSTYWQQVRPIPLTEEEQTDYTKKDSLQVIRSSEKYLDSIDARGNKLGLGSLILGYTYKNSYERWQLNYDGLLRGIAFNTVQGWNVSAELRFASWNNDSFEKVFNASAKANYGFSDDRFRMTGQIAQRFNRTNGLSFSLSGGRKVQQFNPSEPISPLLNSFSSLIFERNYMKVYDLTFARFNYNQEVVNGLTLFASLGFENRDPLFNTTAQTWRPTENFYTSNNPLQPFDYGNAAISSHHLYKATVQARIRFDQKYLSYPDGKFNVPNEDYPTITLIAEQGFGGSQNALDFTQLSARAAQGFAIGNKGSLAYRLEGGKFLNGDQISFVDYAHFDGNQTRISSSDRYLNVFNLMPYYDFSTNDSYFEGHLEHNFKGWVLGKIPGLRALNYNLVLGGHTLLTADNKPYHELSAGLDNLGFGKFRFFRIDYVHSFSEVQNYGAVIFGLQFANFFN